MDTTLIYEDNCGALLLSQADQKTKHLDTSTIGIMLCKNKLNRN